MPAARPLWRCPRCGHRFVSPRMWHSCTRHRIAEHFAGRPPALRALFRRYVALARENGPVTVYAQKSRLVFQARARFAGAVVRKGWLEGAVWFKRRVVHPRFFRILTVTPRDHVHYFRLEREEDLDDDVRGWLRESYAVGASSGISPRRAPRRSRP